MGGCVRDYLLGREPQDYDIATSAVPEQIEALFSRTIPVGRKFGVIIVLEDGHEFQVATFRAEADYQDGRHPEQVTFADAQADASRRDFTVNGLFYDPVAKQLHDWVGGEADLRAKLLRTIGSPDERFAEDHLRLLRAVRFAAQLDFHIEAGNLRGVAGQRAENPHRQRGAHPRGIDEIVSSAARGAGIGFVARQRLAGTDPAGDRGDDHCDQSPDYHPEGTVYNHVRLMLEQLPPDASGFAAVGGVAARCRQAGDRLAGRADRQHPFLRPRKIGAEMAEALLQRLKFPRKQTEEIVTAVLHHMQFKDVTEMRKSTLRRMLMRETFPLELELHRLDCLGSHRRLDHYDFMLEQARELEQQPEIRPPLLTGEDLMALGVKPGPRMGELLAECAKNNCRMN